MRSLVLLCSLVCCMVAKDFAESNRYVVGAYARVGAPMGVGLEFGVPLIKGELVEWRNFVGIEGFGAKLLDASYDSGALLLHEKMTLSYLTGSSVAAVLGVQYFRPYLFVAGGFGFVGGKYNSFGSAPHYAEVSAGIGHEFITQGGHAFFFEFGGGAFFYINALPQQKNATQGATKVVLGYRIYF